MSVEVDPKGGTENFIVTISDTVTNHSGRFEQSLDDLLVLHAQLTTIINSLISALYEDESTRNAFASQASEIAALKEQLEAQRGMIEKLNEASATNAAAVGAALKAANHQF